MSLAKFVESPRLRDAYRQATRPDRARNAALRDWALLVPPPAGREASSGSAFDYMARFRLERMSLERGTGKVTGFDWYAEVALDDLGRRPGWRDMHHRHSRHMAVAKQVVGNWMHGDDAAHARVLDVSQWLSRIELWWRVEERFDPTRTRWIDPVVRDDLAALDSVLVSADPFAGTEHLLLNPTFADAASTRGADADYKADAAMTELKTVGEAAFKAQYMRQLSGYAVMHLRRGGTLLRGGAVDRGPLTHVGIYFGRHGRIAHVALDDLFVPGGFDAYADAFAGEVAVLAASDVPQGDGEGAVAMRYAS